MIFLYIAIGWIVLLVLFVIFWARFAGRRRDLSDSIEQDRARSPRLRVVDDNPDDEKQDPSDVA
ncbi:hypothetical protein [Microlunatus soli]|uniref:Uncharacterized protein n=1 Tax=Microlunatus soli TaxID=630515 RepID=A0A1H1TFI2_9ACTN|nr:hypothetical protein [Microlunatus soli]SDS59017.1 hypothetical protein SAMN04489812_2375 [Microlunatus soli]